jgi:hypothetical protein
MVAMICSQKKATASYGLRREQSYPAIAVKLTTQTAEPAKAKHRTGLEPRQPNPADA